VGPKPEGAPAEKPVFTAPAEVQPEPVEEAKADATILLFKTPTCPNCKLAMALLDKAGVAYTALNANENKELVAQYGVKQAPTLVLLEKDGFASFRGVSDIKGWLMGKK
jgi:ribonucleoside-triphosphate reductase